MIRKEMISFACPLVLRATTLTPKSTKPYTCTCTESAPSPSCENAVASITCAPRELASVASARVALTTSSVMLRTAHVMFPYAGDAEHGRSEAFKKDKSEGRRLKARERKVAKEGPVLLMEVEKVKEEPAITLVGALMIVFSIAAPIGWRVMLASLLVGFESYRISK
jgi:hypothetical protein